MPLHGQLFNFPMLSWDECCQFHIFREQFWMLEVVLLNWSGCIVRENSDASLFARWGLVQSESDSGVTHVKVKVALLNQSGCIVSEIWRTILNGKSGECSTRVVALSKKIPMHPSLQVGRLAKVTAGRWLRTDRMQLSFSPCLFHFFTFTSILGC